MNRRVLLGCLGLLAVVTLLWMWRLYGPAGARLDEARSEQAQLDDQYQRLEVDLARLQSIEADLPRIQSGIDTLRVAVPDEAGLAELILTLNEVALAAGLEAANLSFSAPTPAANGLLEISIRTEVDGGYYQVLDFLNRLAELPRVVVVSGIEIDTEQDDDPSVEPRLFVGLTARVFVNPEGAASAVPVTADDGQPSEGEPPSDPTGEDQQ